MLNQDPEKLLSPTCFGPEPGRLCERHNVLVGGGGQRGSDGWSTSGVTTATTSTRNDHVI